MLATLQLVLRREIPRESPLTPGSVTGGGVLARKAEVALPVNERSTYPNVRQLQLDFSQELYGL